MTHETAVMIIQEELDRISMENERKHYQQALMNYSYSKWAVQEILDYVNLNATKNPVIVVGIFKRKMQDYIRRGTDSIMFSVAYDVAENILDIFNAAM